ncbi:hypothetical protein KIN20_003246 [Parelaphostrongylus tenuis]|uniref:Uncharacterized protein n=1 Tax=Parelaphostrongylus tenuis TaxID=148309 RepID=A0AAD5LYV8_PARTN|nr:hypothetical protein KIN20_003246 [Parelaphostrongylus tenuis]
MCGNDRSIKYGYVGLLSIGSHSKWPFGTRKEIRFSLNHLRPHKKSSSLPTQEGITSAHIEGVTSAHTTRRYLSPASHQSIDDVVKAARALRRSLSILSGRKRAEVAHSLALLRMFYLKILSQYRILS